MSGEIGHLFEKKCGGTLEQIFERPIYNFPCHKLNSDVACICNGISEEKYIRQENIQQEYNLIVEGSVSQKTK
jgi:hypothetical protein